MANRRTPTMDVHEVVRLLQAGASDREVAQLVGRNRRTVARYRRWAEREGVLAGPLPAMGELETRLATSLSATLPPQQTSTVERYREEIVALRAQGVEAAAIKTRLEERHQVSISYSAVWRLVRRLEPPDQPETFVRVEVPPGSEAQVDFGAAGRAIDPADGRVRKAWVFVLVLAWSRHSYAEVVFDQRVETWLLCHRHGFEFFGGVPERVVLDNLKAAIIKASLHDPLVQRSYRECAQPYGFRIMALPPRTPHLKGKVEQGGVHYVARNFLAGREPEPLDVLNGKLRQWLVEVAGRRIHGTTKVPPLERFEPVERGALRPLPVVGYDPASWKQAGVYRDGYVVFEGAYYSVPFRLVGQTVWIRGGARTVELFTADHQLVATHDRARQPGDRLTTLAHLPPHKVPGLTASRATCRQQAEAIGPATLVLVGRLLDHRPEDRLKIAQRVLRLGTTCGSDRLERACARALFYDSPEYPTLKRILAAGLDASALDAATAPAPRGRFTFARQAGELVRGLFGGHHDDRE
jgi:transposase